MAILNDSGVEIQKIGGILQELQSIARKRFADLVEPDDELDLSDSSVLGRIFGTIAEPEASNEELLLQLWQTLDPDQAEGIFLDKIQTLSGLVRKGEIKGYAGLMLYGTIGTLIPERALVSSKVTGDVFETTLPVTFGSDDANGVVFNIETVAPDTVYKIGYKSEYGTNTYPTITVTAVSGDTKEIVAKRIVETIKSSSTLLEASVDLDDRVVVRFKNRNYVGKFSTQTAGLTIHSSYMPVPSISATADATRQEAGTLDVMQTSVIGWLGVTNPFDSIASEPSEDDKTFRLRGRFSRSIKSTSNRMSLYSDLYNLNGVRFVNIKENVYDNPAGGRSAKGISVVVLGGDDQEIAEAIAENIPNGCLTDGLIKLVITDDAGDQDIRFSRPEFVDIQIKLSLSADSTFPQNGKLLIQEALVRYFDSLEVGDSVIWSKLFNPINEVSGQSVNTLLIGKKGQPLASTNITLNYNQLPVISFEDIEI